MKQLFFLIATIIAATFVLASCEGRDKPEDPKTFDNIFIVYSAGKNNLSRLLQEDILNLKDGYVPYKGSGNACIIVTHSSPNSRSFEQDTNPYIIRMYKERKTEEVVMDTLKILPTETMLTRASDMNSILTYIADNFKADTYGMLFSSHGTGWLPKGYYGNESKYDKSSFISTPSMAAPAFTPHENTVTYDAASIPEFPVVKSAGQEYTQSGSVITSYELDMNEIADAIPFKMEYIIFDACLMGCVEVAYAVKDKCKYLAFSPAEILTDGFDYTNMGSRLMEYDSPDLKRVCEDFFNKYKDKSGSQCTATISLVDCSQLEYLGSVCQRLFANHRKDIARLNPKEIQQFSRDEYLWFFDLRDILVKAGCDDIELSSLDNALEQCVLYKASTKRILSLFDVKTYCGLSMFLPSSGSAYLNDFYKTLTWNIDTGLDN